MRTQLRSPQGYALVRSNVPVLGQVGDIAPGAGCKPVADLSCVLLRSRAKQNNKLPVETYSDYQVAEYLAFPIVS